MLDLSSRPCTIGCSINNRTEKHGDEDVPALDLSVLKVTLDMDEIDELLECKRPVEASRLFNKRAEPIEPAFPHFQPLVLTHKFEGVKVELLLGIDEHLVLLEDSKIAKLTLEPQVGGMTLLSCQVQYNGEIEDEDLGRLRQAMNHEARIRLSGGKIAEAKRKKQLELPLDHNAEGEAPETDEVDAQPRMN